MLAGVDGLPGLPEAIEAVLPQRQVPGCLGHQVRHRLRSGPWQARRAVAADVRAIYGAAPRPEAEPALERCAECWATPDPALRPSWRAAGDRLPVGVDAPPAIRRALSTTKAIAS